MTRSGHLEHAPDHGGFLRIDFVLGMLPFPDKRVTESLRARRMPQPRFADQGIPHPPNMPQKIARRDLNYCHKVRDERGWQKTVEMLLKLERIRQDQ